MKRPFVRGRNTAGMSVRDLATMSRAELLDAWAQVVRKPAVRSASRELLVHTIAWHLQAQQRGGLSKSVQRRLERLAATIDGGESVGLVNARSNARGHHAGAGMARRDASLRSRPTGLCIEASATLVCPRSRVSSPAPGGMVRRSSVSDRARTRLPRVLTMPSKQSLRWCAVYTRKSSEEGLEQQFNSLDAQREAG